MNQKSLTKDISCECKYKLIMENVIQIKSGIMIKVDVTVKNIDLKKNCESCYM